MTVHNVGHPARATRASPVTRSPTSSKEQDIRFLRLDFTDILGMNKNVEVPTSQFDKALDGQIMFDGSSIQGFVRIEESDMLLQPDFDTFRIYPWENDGKRQGRAHHLRRGTAPTARRSTAARVAP